MMDFLFRPTAVPTLLNKEYSTDLLPWPERQNQTILLADLNHSFNFFFFHNLQTAGIVTLVARTLL